MNSLTKPERVFLLEAIEFYQQYGADGDCRKNIDEPAMIDSLKKKLNHSSGVDCSTLADLGKRIHKNSIEKGYWNPDNWTPELCRFAVKALLIISEVSEMFEAFRDDPNKKDKHVPEMPAVTVEAADILIRTIGFCEGFGLDYQKAIDAKMTHNETTERRKRF